MKSMTAFARIQRTAKWGDFSWEIRSVNQRFLELSFKLPDRYRYLETAIRAQLKQTLSRGKVEISLSIEQTENQPNFKVNQVILQPLVNAVNEVQQSLMEATHVNPLDVLRWPGVLQSESPQAETAQEIDTALLAGLNDTITALNAHRQREGQALSEILKLRSLEVKQFTAEAQRLMPEIIERQTEKLRLKITTLLDDADENRFYQEVTLLAQKLDVQEELDRLRTHLLEIDHVLTQTGPVGRRLDFLMQELNREANTLGAKSADSRTSKISIELKVLIEQMREQVQNVE